jgi:hypothetical protein
MNAKGKRKRSFAICLTLAALLVSTLISSCASVHCSTEGTGGGPGGCGFEQHFTTY